MNFLKKVSMLMFLATVPSMMPAPAMETTTPKAKTRKSSSNETLTSQQGSRNSGAKAKEIIAEQNAKNSMKNKPSEYGDTFINGNSIFRESKPQSKSSPAEYGDTFINGNSIFKESKPQNKLSQIETAQPEYGNTFINGNSIFRESKPQSKSSSPAEYGDTSINGNSIFRDSAPTPELSPTNIYNVRSKLKQEKAFNSNVAPELSSNNIYNVSSKLKQESAMNPSRQSEIEFTGFSKKNELRDSTPARELSPTNIYNVSSQLQPSPVKTAQIATRGERLKTANEELNDMISRNEKTNIGPKQPNQMIIQNYLKSQSPSQLFEFLTTAPARNNSSATQPLNRANVWEAVTSNLAEFTGLTALRSKLNKSEQNAVTEAVKSAEQAAQAQVETAVGNGTATPSMIQRIMSSFSNSLRAIGERFGLKSSTVPSEPVVVAEPTGTTSMLGEGRAPVEGNKLTPIAKIKSIQNEIITDVNGNKYTVKENSIIDANGNRVEVINNKLFGEKYNAGLGNKGEFSLHDLFSKRAESNTTSPALFENGLGNTGGELSFGDGGGY
ncbi:hypothetical protein KBC04_04750 [Candidatus Babeliales bacterium]|nr:hypothetical protein [Candidatus Babeliales bacterium]MBP9844358.1 hypothetical protein [Candidatus Babeliales bacterium]